MASVQGKHPRDPSTAKGHKKLKKRKLPPVVEGARDDVLAWEIKSFLNSFEKEGESDTEEEVLPFNKFDEVEVTIKEFTSSGDGLGLIHRGKHAVIVPFTVPGDKVIAKLFRIESSHSQADLVKVIEPSSSRDDSLIKCRYFGKCAGCQFQMLSYNDQLQFKKSVIEKAFQRYFPLEPEKLPEIDHTNPSPLTYGYRTKITPHFNIPRSVAKKGQTVHPAEIGFNEKSTPRILDIEECPIATPVLNEELTKQRAIAKSSMYKRGATLLLREALDISESSTPSKEPRKRCVTDSKEIITEKVGKYTFNFPAGAFFQNNNSILGDFTGYVHDQIITASDRIGLSNQPKYLVDAHCGSGLFSVTCAEGFESVIGVEISADSVQYAIENAKRNNVRNASFITGSADKIFEVIKTPPDQTAVIIDPPRKGCDNSFLEQLVTFNPRIIVYVSCNVHTQARDIKFLFKGEEPKYRILAIRGFDLFPQTHHIESIATLVRD